MKNAAFLSRILSRAKESNKTGKLNWILWKVIPFNKPHGIKILSLEEDSVTTYIPYKKKNFNHLKGIHACAICTAGEFAAGMLLISHLPIDKYRLIMSELKTEYHLQGRSALTAVSRFAEGVTIDKLKKQLDSEDKVLTDMVTELSDSKNELIATVTTTWQLKNWEKVTLK